MEGHVGREVEFRCVQEASGKGGGSSCLLDRGSSVYRDQSTRPADQGDFLVCYSLRFIPRYFPFSFSRVFSIVSNFRFDLQTREKTIRQQPVEKKDRSRIPSVVFVRSSVIEKESTTRSSGRSEKTEAQARESSIGDERTMDRVRFTLANDDFVGAVLRSERLRIASRSRLENLSGRIPVDRPRGCETVSPFWLGSFELPNQDLYVSGASHRQEHISVREFRRGTSRFLRFSLSFSKLLPSSLPPSLFLPHSSPLRDIASNTLLRRGRRVSNRSEIDEKAAG